MIFKAFAILVSLQDLIPWPQQSKWCDSAWL